MSDSLPLETRDLRDPACPLFWLGRWFDLAMAPRALAQEVGAPLLELFYVRCGWTPAHVALLWVLTDGALPCEARADVDLGDASAKWITCADFARTAPLAQELARTMAQAANGAESLCSAVEIVMPPNGPGMPPLAERIENATVYATTPAWYRLLVHAQLLGVLALKDRMPGLLQKLGIAVKTTPETPVQGA